MKGKMAKDIRILVGEAAAGAVLAVLALVLKPNADFTRGLFLGFGAVFAAISVIVAVRRIRGSRRFGETDERERMLTGKAASVAVFATVLALALFIILAASVPAVGSVNAVPLAVATVLFLSGTYRIGSFMLKRLG